MQIEEQRRHRQHGDVVHEHGRQNASCADHHGEQQSGIHVGGRDSPGDLGVEPGDPQLRRDEHQPEEQDEGR